MDIENLKKQINASVTRIKGERKHLEGLQQALAEQACPFKVGDRVIKPKGEKEIIASVGYYPLKPYYRFKVFKIKKNGEPYANINYAYRPEAYTLKEDQ